MRDTVALVTGASRGIGLSCAIALAKSGALVYLMGRTVDGLEAGVERIRTEGGRGHALACDVTSSDTVRMAIARVPRLDILVNNAGGNIPEPFVDVSEEHLDRLLDLNVRAAFVVAQASIKKMLEDKQRKVIGGVVINMSSQMGRVGAPNRTVYCMCKHAIEGLTKAMAVELAPWNIRVNAVAPTFIETPMTRQFFKNEDFRKWVTDRIPLGRIGSEGDVANAVLFLVSQNAGLITGTSVAIDGGWTAQ